MRRHFMTKAPAHVAAYPTYVSSGTYVNGGAQNNATIPYAPSLVVGNVLVLFWGNKTNQVTSIIDPAGWTPLDNVGPNTIARSWWRVVDGTEGANALFQWTTAVTWCAQMFQFTGVKTSGGGPIGNHEMETKTSSPITSTALACSTTDKSTVIAWLLNSTANTTIPSPASGWADLEKHAANNGSDAVFLANKDAGQSTTAISVASTTGRAYSSQVELLAA